mmetsp:Transcript_32391/g.74934  ORF Transcript_32391/g.74934 Transcript_32391/m.74934 type:complete len:264 (+) Transcript_32391:26-817(+)
MWWPMNATCSLTKAAAVGLSVTNARTHSHATPSKLQPNLKRPALLSFAAISVQSTTRFPPSSSRSISDHSSVLKKSMLPLRAKLATRKCGSSKSGTTTRSQISISARTSSGSETHWISVPSSLFRCSSRQYCPGSKFVVKNRSADCLLPSDGGSPSAKRRSDPLCAKPLATGRSLAGFARVLPGVTLPSPAVGCVNDGSGTTCARKIRYSSARGTDQSFPCPDQLTRQDTFPFPLSCTVSGNTRSDSRRTSGAFFTSTIRATA